MSSLNSQNMLVSLVVHCIGDQYSHVANREMNLMSDTIHPDTNPQYEEIDIVKNGPHSHWSPFDLALEGCRWHALDKVISTSPFDAPAAEVLAAELIAFGQGYGYGQADSYTADIGKMSEEEIEANTEFSIIRDALFSSYNETEYFDLMYKSQNKIMKGSATPEALALSRGLASRIEEAFEKGRDMCMDQSKTSEDEVSSSPSI